MLSVGILYQDNVLTRMGSNPCTANFVHFEWIVTLREVDRDRSLPIHEGYKLQASVEEEQLTLFGAESAQG